MMAARCPATAHTDRVPGWATAHSPVAGGPPCSSPGCPWALNDPGPGSAPASPLGHPSASSPASQPLPPSPPQRSPAGRATSRARFESCASTCSTSDLGRPRRPQSTLGCLGNVLANNGATRSKYHEAGPKAHVWNTLRVRSGAARSESFGPADPANDVAKVAGAEVRSIRRGSRH